MYHSGWYKGTITAFQAGWYTVTWVDETTSKYDDLARVQQMVDMAASMANGAGGSTSSGTGTITTQDFPIGTPVYASFGGDWSTGQITGFDNGQYEVTWSDDSVYYYGNVNDVQEMVEASEHKAMVEENNYLTMEKEEQTSKGATAVIVIAVLALSAGVVLIVIRRKRAGKAKDVPPPPRGSPEKVSGTGEANIADLKATSSNIVSIV